MTTVLQPRLRSAAPCDWPLPGGSWATLRLLAPGDVDAERVFFNGLSLDARHQRFHFGLRELSPALLRLLTDVDQRLHRAWVLALCIPGQPLIADVRFVADPNRPGEAEFALAVGDSWQGRGLGRRLTAHLIAEARRAGVQWLHGDVLAENRRMLALMREFGMQLQPHPDGAELVRARLRIDTAR